MTRWQRLEAYLVAHHNVGSAFTVYDYAAAEDLASYDASQDIRSYLDAQRRPNRRTAFVLYRAVGRTSAAIWRVGERAKDVRSVSDMLFDDTATKLSRALFPDLVAMAETNPRMRSKVEAITESTMHGAMVVLRNALRGIEDDGA